MSQKIEIIASDVIEWAKSYSGPRFMALFCDPPYHLVSINKRFGKGGSKAAKQGKDGQFSRLSGGFMQAKWDGVDPETGQGVAFMPETWSALAELLHRGAYGLCYGSPKTRHRMAVAIEDATVRRIGNPERRDNLILHPEILIYVYGNGAVKARAPHDRGQVLDGFEGHRYGGQGLRPAFEPLELWQRPYQGRPADVMRETGAGALWIDGCRIPRAGNDDAGYPAHLALHHLPECGLYGECSPACPVRALDEQTGNLGKHGSTTGQEPSADNSSPYIFGSGTSRDGSDIYDSGFRREKGRPGFDDDGGASRYFNVFDWTYDIAERIALSDKLTYVTKPGPLERDAGLWDMPVRLRQRANKGGFSKKKSWAEQGRRNPHPTLKSIKACEHYARLILPPEKYAPRRIMIPFCGSGSEICGALLAGWEEVVAIEANPVFAEIAGVRTSWWLKQIESGLTDVDAILDSAKQEIETLQAGGKQSTIFDLL